MRQRNRHQRRKAERSTRRQRPRTPRQQTWKGWALSVALVLLLVAVFVARALQ